MAGEIVGIFGRNGARQVDMLRTIAGDAAARPRVGDLPGHRPPRACCGARHRPQGGVHPVVREGPKAFETLTSRQGTPAAGLRLARRSGRDRTRPRPSTSCSAARRPAGDGRRPAERRPARRPWPWPSAARRGRRCCCSTSRRPAWPRRVVETVYAIVRQLADDSIVPRRRAEPRVAGPVGDPWLLKTSRSGGVGSPSSFLKAPVQRAERPFNRLDRHLDFNSSASGW